ncbi:hypothetical protein [Mycolicibacterium helvum]|uniref:Lipopolysaccharide assembly protein A domain-containing protein n=1 Tax=Mycolicibacterium helvum TaxID=1534349 RepID=A0A7I7TCF2_9MYCO|nr:hypothetical protein [Mycolicibacterium helvum]BBY65836.1 hypothetical protein MHEL_40790 [Mycolicibacterium helvum]
MIVIGGLMLLLVAMIVAVTGVLANAGPGHPLTGNFAVLGYHVTGSTGTLFVFGMVIGALAMLGLSLVLAGARRTAARGRDARLELRHSQRESALLSRDRDLLLEQQRPGRDDGPATASAEPATHSNRIPLLRRWPRKRQSIGTSNQGR